MVIIITMMTPGTLILQHCNGFKSQSELLISNKSCIQLTLNYRCLYRFVHPIYPSECTDDLEYILENNCIELSPLPSIARQEFVLLLSDISFI